MRNGSKNKLLLCFRPVVDLDVMLESRVSCVSVADKDAMKHSETKSLFLDKGCPEFSENSMTNHPPKRTLSRMIKAMVFETILNRRARRKNRYRQDSCGSNSSYSTYTESSSTGDEKSKFSQASVDQEINPESQLPSCSSASSESCASEAKQKERSYGDSLEKQKKFDYSVICLFLISLTLTVFWGKILGIILTSIWLYFYSNWDASYRRQKEAAKLPKTESKAYKKRGHKGRSARKQQSERAFNF